MADVGIKINSLFIPGYVLRPHRGAARLLTARQHRWGTVGVTEIRSLAGQREFEIPMTIFKGTGGTGGYASYDALNQLINTIHARTGEHGTLTIVLPSYTEKHESVTFEGLTDGERGPLPDIGGGLGGGVNKWYMDAVLRFTKLKP